MSVRLDDQGKSARGSPSARDDNRGIGRRVGRGELVGYLRKGDCHCPYVISLSVYLFYIFTMLWGEGQGYCTKTSVFSDFGRSVILSQKRTDFDLINQEGSNFLGSLLASCLA